MASTLAGQLERMRAEQLERKRADQMEPKQAALVDMKMDSSEQPLAHSEQPECKRKAWEPRSWMEPAEEEKVSSEFFAP
jgi:hypothetical protein